jgi:hypothetical protein
VQKLNSNRTFILHAPPNSPSHPQFLEALHFPLQMWAPPFLFSPLIFLFIPYPPANPTGAGPPAVAARTAALVVVRRPPSTFSTPAS